MTRRSFQDIAVDLAELLPHRFIWFSSHTCMRISVDGHHRTGGPCMNAFLEHVPHHGMVFQALSDECEARNWHSKHWRVKHCEFTHACIVSPDWDAAEFSGDADGYAWAFAEAMIQAVRQVASSLRLRGCETTPEQIKEHLASAEGASHE